MNINLNIFGDTRGLIWTNVALSIALILMLRKPTRQQANGEHAHLIYKKELS